MIRTAAKFAVALVLLGAGSAQAATLQQVGGFFRGAVFVTSAPGNPEQLLVADRNGRVVLYEDGVASTLANFEDKVSCCENEQGLNSVVPAPDFATSGRLYVDYSGVEEAGGEIHVAELVVTQPGGPFTLDDLLVIPHPVEKIHYAGQLQFGPEGNLFVSVGDGGPGNDANHHAQDPESLLGKILRLKPNPAAPEHHEVPTDNPFFGATPGAEEIWSLGLRNPFRFSFDRLNGAMVIGDVGQSEREEIDYAPAPLRGKAFNYGWNCREGLIAGPATDPQCAGKTAEDFVDPVFDYPHEDPGGGKAFGCAIIGGYVDRDPTTPELFGRYIYGDFCSGMIRSLDLSDPFGSDRSEGISLPTNLESFGEDSAGRLYALGAGAIYRLVAPESPKPLVEAHVGIRTLGRKVERGGRATIIAFVSPCVRDRALSTTLRLVRGRRQLERKHLSRVCTVSFRPRISRRSNFRAKLVENSTYAAGESRRLTIKPRRRHHH